MCPYCCSKNWKWTGCDDECECQDCKKIFPAMGIYEGEKMSDKDKMKLARLEGYLEEGIKQIEKDNRFHYPKATILVNAPLALIQLEMETQHKIYIKILGMLKTVPKEVLKAKNL